MIDRNCLKKGDKVLIVNKDFLRTRDEKPEEVYVISIGKKFIGVQPKDSKGEFYGPVDKFYNDEYMEMVDWGQKCLFLGTVEEHELAKKFAKKARDLYLSVNRKMSENLGWEKLEAIKAIIESDSVADAIDKISGTVTHYGPARAYLMKKILFVIALLFMFTSCDEQCTVPAERCVPQVEDEIGLYVVEDKEYGTCMLANHRYLILGDAKTHELRRVEIGKYSFDQINVGDTIEWEKEKMK